MGNWEIAVYLAVAGDVSNGVFFFFFLGGGGGAVPFPTRYLG